MVVWQRNEPEGFQGSDFENLNKIVSIWIVLKPPAKLAGKQIYIHDQVESDTEVEEDYSMRRVILMFLHKEIDVTDKSALMMLSVLFDDRMSNNERIFLLKEEYGILLSKEGEEMMSEWNNTAEAFIERGFERGYDQGNMEGIEKVARQMLHMGLSDEMVVKACNLSYEEIEKLKKGEKPQGE